MKALVLFGSKADGPVSDLIVGQLKSAGFEEVSQHYVSAHRNPEGLAKVLAEAQYDIIVTGAGLAAHLPGVAASKTMKPVFGVPVAAAFGGLDALVNMIQMPPGIPVCTLTTAGLKGAGSIWKAVAAVRSDQAPSVHFVADKKTTLSDLTKKARAILDTAAVQWTSGPKLIGGKCNIVACPGGVVPRALRIPPHTLAIFVPVFDPAKLKKPAAFYPFVRKVADSRAKGAWVGANNFTNAACAALQCLARGGAHDDLLRLVKKGEF